MEQKLLFLINREWTSPSLDRFMAAISSFDLWLAPLVVTILLVLIFGGFRARAMVLVLGFVIGVSDGGISDSLKKIVARPRPHEVLGNVRRVDLQKEKPRWKVLFKQARVIFSRPNPGVTAGRSFPSSHTMNNFCAAIVLTYFYGRKGALYFFVAALVAYSRIYVGAHWPSDIAISIILACGSALLLIVFAEWTWRLLAPRLLPPLFALHPSLRKTA